MATPNIPLIINVAISLLVKSKKDISIRIMVIVKPITPIIFLIKLICKLVSDFPDNSNRITADDQQKAVKTANISPKLKFNFISCFKIKPKKIVETYIQFFFWNLILNYFIVVIWLHVSKRLGITSKPTNL